MISAFVGFVFCDVSRLWTADANGLVTVMQTNPENNLKEAVHYTAGSGMVPVCVMAVSAVVMLICGLLMRRPKLKWLSEYALPISLIVGMAAAIPLTAILGMEVSK
jgi:cytochrome b subunit of formate dehydrogenase